MVLNHLCENENFLNGFIQNLSQINQILSCNKSNTVRLEKHSEILIIC
jgi:hypothetical protein